MSSAELFSHRNISSFLAGATSGLCVDLILFPLDTIKTRLQSSSHALRPAGELRLFAGLPAVLLGSAPSAAMFFFSYESTKFASLQCGLPIWISSMFAASIGEIMACILRVPSEVVKQRAQSKPSIRISTIVTDAVKSEGFRGFYRGYLSTIFRDLPFSLIQYPVWELLKETMRNRNTLAGLQVPTGGYGEKDLTNVQFALCGSLAGAISGACTTPLDVIKTRIMLADKSSILATGNVISALKVVYSEAGTVGLFAGLIPRVALLSIGGGIFLGLYDIAKRYFTKITE